MGRLKEFTVNEDLFSDWLPWGALITPRVLLNKDNSMMATFICEPLPGGVDNVIDGIIVGLRKVLLGLGSGWTIYSELDGRNVHYVTLFWMPRLEKCVVKNVPVGLVIEGLEDKESLYVFELVLDMMKESLNKVCLVQDVERQGYFDYLRSTICFDGSRVPMPEKPLYMDAILSMDITIDGEQEEPVVNGYFLKVVSPLGYLGNRTHELITRLNDAGIVYRFVSRFVFFSHEDIQKEEERYMKTWCEGRRSMLGLLEYGDLENRQCGYYTAAVVVWDQEEKVVRKKTQLVEGVIQDMGIPAVAEDYNLKDVWYGTIPGMVRANLKPPMVVVEDVLELLMLS